MINEENNSLIKSTPGLLKLLHQSGTSIDVFRKDMLALSCLVAGTSFRSLKEAEPLINLQTVFKLKREQDNEFDKKAVAIYFDEEKIGYVPKAKNEVIANLMDEGKRFSAKLISKEWEGDWLKLDIEVYLND